MQGRLGLLQFMLAKSQHSLIHCKNHDCADGDSECSLKLLSLKLSALLIGVPWSKQLCSMRK